MPVPIIKAYAREPGCVRVAEGATRPETLRQKGAYLSIGSGEWLQPSGPPKGQGVTTPISQVSGQRGDNGSTSPVVLFCL